MSCFPSPDPVRALPRSRLLGQLRSQPVRADQVHAGRLGLSGQIDGQPLLVSTGQECPDDSRVPPKTCFWPASRMLLCAPVTGSTVTFCHDLGRRTN